MKKRSKRINVVLAMFMTVAILWSNSLGVYAKECPSPYSPTGYHDFSKHNMKERAGTIEWDHDVYVGKRSGVAVYQKCHVVVPFQWCETSCCFCDMPGGEGRHAHSGNKSHSLGCKD